MCSFVQASYLISIHHEVVGGDKRLEDHHPARVGCPFKQCVCQLGNVHVHLIGTVDEIWHWKGGKLNYTAADNKAVIRKALKCLITLIENSSKMHFTCRNSEAQRHSKDSKHHTHS